MNNDRWWGTSTIYCQAPFAIKEDYTNAVWCDVVSMDSRDISLEWKYMYDRLDHMGCKTITYIFVHNEKLVTLCLKPLKKESRACVTRSSSSKSCLQK